MVRFDIPCVNVTHALNYFKMHMAGDDYLTEHGQAEMVWVGKDAARLGLHGTVQKDDFRKLCEGKHPIAQQQLARSEDRFGFQKHLIRFHRREELGRAVLHDSRLELVLMNSHDGGCAFRLFAGVFRLVCSNGLVVSEASFGAISIRHTHRTVEQVVDASQKIVHNSDGIGTRIDSFRQRMLSEPERVDFANRALALRYKSAEEAPVRPAFLLEPKRVEDRGSSLWQTFNVVQERMMRGSRPDRFKAAQEHRRTARVRGLTGLDAQLNINRNLWELAASYLN